MTIHLIADRTTQRRGRVSTPVRHQARRTDCLISATEDRQSASSFIEICMPIRVRCSGCQKTLKVPEKFAGKRIRCPVCQIAVQVPGETFDPSETSTNSLAATSAIPTLSTSSDGG